MDRTDDLEWQRLMPLMTQTGGGPYLSLFLPTHRIASAVRQDRIRCKNLVAEAERQLHAYGLRRTTIEPCLAPVRALIEDLEFWNHQRDGLALFVHQGTSTHFRVPRAFPELVVVSDCFHVKPLLPAFVEDTRFYLLAASRAKVRLFVGSRDRLDELDRGDIPGDMAEVVGGEVVQDALQFHTRAPGPQGARRAIFHGHGLGSDDRIIELMAYVRTIDGAVSRRLGDEGVPLVLAGVPELVGMYRSVSRYPALVPQAVEGNPDELTAEALHGLAWSLVQPRLQHEYRAVVERYLDLAPIGRASTELAPTLRAAVEGRIEVLFVDRDAFVWGRFDPDVGMLEHHDDGRRPGDHDLLDRAAVVCLLKGADVHVRDRSELPEPEQPLAAILRYPVGTGE